jgi:hypothetical protein
VMLAQPLSVNAISTYDSVKRTQVVLDRRRHVRLLGDHA